MIIYVHDFVRISVCPYLHVCICYIQFYIEQVLIVKVNRQCHVKQGVQGEIIHFQER